MSVRACDCVLCKLDLTDECHDRVCNCLTLGRFNVQANVSPGDLRPETLRLSLACDWDGWQQPDGILKLCLIDPQWGRSTSAAVFIAADGTRNFAGSPSTAAPEVFFEI